MKASTKLILAATILGTFGLLGLAKSVWANPSNPYVATVASSNFQIAQASDDVKQRQEAKITSQQAQRAAEAYLGGQAREVELENDDGKLVYEVTIGQTEVTVDANNGKVLYTEKVDD